MSREAYMSQEYLRLNYIYVEIVSPTFINLHIRKADEPNMVTPRIFGLYWYEITSEIDQQLLY